MEGGLNFLKVSKPILIALVLSILFALYTLMFTGKKRPSGPSAPALKATETSPSRASQPVIDAEKPKLTISTMNFAWQNDPFLLPKSVTDKKTEKQKIVPRLTAIMESKAGRYAIIGGEIVGKGDRIGDEKVAEIKRDKVVLIRNNAKRILSIDDAGQ